MPKYPWFRNRKKTDPELPLRTPIPFGDISNGEFYAPKTKAHRLIEKLVFERAAETARKHGMDRREFLATTMGFATCLATMNEVMGCASGTSDVNPDDAKSDAGGRVKLECTDKPFVVPTEATCAETDYLSGTEFIFDIQTHAFDQGEWREKNTAIVDFLANTIGRARTILSTCTEPEVLDCYNRNYYGELMFADSDTSMAVITSWPANTCEGEKVIGCGLPLSNQAMRDLREWINERAMSERCVNQIQVMPNDRWSLQKDIMTMAVQDPEWRAVSWKAYPAWKSDSYRPNGLPSGYFLTDDLGQAFIQHGLDLCVPNFAIHKGLSIPGFDVEHNQTIDVGPAAKMFPDANFIIYHSGINAGCEVTGSGLSIEGGSCNEAIPYDPDEPDPKGLNQLVRSLIDSEVAPNSNVYAELGACWLLVATDSNVGTAQHFMGKLLKYVGEDNVVWGTDSILFGSPQFQIQLFRSFQITEQFQNDFEYPAMTPEIKAKILGLNAARIFRIDPERARCKVEGSQFAQAKRRIDAELGPNRWAMKEPLGPRTAGEFARYSRESIIKKRPG